MLPTSRYERPIVLWIGLVLVAVATGCSSSDSRPSKTAAPVERGEDAVVATIEGRPIKMSEIEEAVGDRLAAMEFQYRSQRYELIQQTLKKTVWDRLLEEEAESRGTSVEEMIAAETEGIEVSEQEATQWYRENRQRMGGRPLEQLLPQIQNFLLRQKKENVKATLAEGLEQKKSVVYQLEPMRADIDVDGAPFKGPDDAPVTVVEFSDFECGFCGRLVQTLDQVAGNYGKRVRIVFKQFPLTMHPNAFKAAEAALCAHDQGKFWNMHDLLFREQNQLQLVALKEKASKLGLDRTDFDECLSSGRHSERVQKDLRDGAALGVTGTPAIFVNGRPVSGGAVPYEVLSGVIDDELERTGQN